MHILTVMHNRAVVLVLHNRELTMQQLLKVVIQHIKNMKNQNNVEVKEGAVERNLAKKRNPVGVKRVANVQRKDVEIKEVDAVVR